MTSTAIDLDARALGRSPRSELSAVIRSRVAWISLLLVFAAWGAYTCYVNLGSANYQADETTYLHAGFLYFHGNFAFNREHPPLAKELIGIAEHFGGVTRLAGRLMTTSFVFAAGWVVFFWLRREIGPVWAAIAAAAWWLLPRAASGAGIRVDRVGILEPYMVAFAIASVALAWWWFRRGHWWLAAAAGAAMACSVTSKISTALLVLSFVYLVARRKQLRRGVTAIAIYAVSFVGVFVVVYLPSGVVSSLSYMVVFQSRERAAASGSRTPTPWWANLDYTLSGLGPWLLAALLVGIVLAFVPKPSELAAYVAVCGLILVAFYCLVAGKALPHYYYAWVWAMIVLAVIGVSSLWRVTRRPGRTEGHASQIRWARALGIAVLLVFAVNAVITTQAVRSERATGWARVGDVLESHGRASHWVLQTGFPSWTWLPYLGGRVRGPVYSGAGWSRLPTAPVPYNALARAEGGIRTNPIIDHFIAAEAARLTEVTVDAVHLYIPTGHWRLLVTPTSIKMVTIGVGG